MSSANVPEGIGYGVVHAHVVSFLADGSDYGRSPDGVPDEVPLTGKVIFTPTVTTLKFPTLSPPRFAALEKIECPLIGGFLFPPDTTEENAPHVQAGVVLTATDQPLALPPTFQYTVSWQLDSTRAAPASSAIDVPADGIVDLATVIPASSEPGVIKMISHEDRIAAEEAAALAVQASGDAVAARLTAVSSAQAAAVSASAVASPTMQVSWSGNVTLPAGVGWVEATLTGNAVLSLPGRGVAAEMVNLLVKQDAVGSRTLTIPGAKIAYGVAYTPSTAPSSIDMVSLAWTGTEWLILPGALNLKAAS